MAEIYNNFLINSFAGLLWSFLADLGGKALSLSPLSMIFSFKVFIDALFQVEELLFLFCRKFLLE